MNMQTESSTEETASPVRPDTLGVVEAWESAIHRWLMRYSITVLRISMGAVVLGFGFLKYFPGVSPAEDLALATTHLLTFGLVPAVVPNSVAIVLIATLECAIGLLLITGRWLRLTIVLLVVQLTGILSPAVLLAGREFAGPYHMPTLEGQYVLKDVILFAAAMVIATTVRGGAITDGEHRGSQTK
jgi:putative oxidoreductase